MLLGGDAFEAPAGGGFAVLSREPAEEELLAAVRAVAAGLVVFSREEYEAMRAPDVAPASAASTSAAPLTPREIEVVRLLAEGEPNKILADRLGVSEHTVKFHVASIMHKLGAGSRTEAVMKGIRLGIVPL